MKNFIIILLLLAATRVNAQNIRIKSYLGDSITVIKGYKQLTPIIVTMNGDSARSCIWYVNISRDSTSSGSLNVLLFDKNAAVIGNRTLSIQESNYNKWSGLFTAIDNYLHNQISRIVLH
jgi:hypothetical protein